MGSLPPRDGRGRSLQALLEAAQPFARGDQLRRLLEDVRGICRRERDWRRVRAWLDPRYGYGVFPGPCPILSNHAMVLAALLLGGDDFRRAVTIAASAGYDTDCNAGSVGCLNGVRLGLAAIPDDGAPHDFRQRGMLMSSIWNLRPYWLRAWVSAAREFAPDFELTYCTSHSDENGLVTLGTRAWRDYSVETRLRFSLHRSGGLVLRARGLRRYYAALFSGGDRLAIVARQDGAVHTLAQAAFPYEMERLYALRFTAVGDRMALAVDGVPLLEARDDRYRSGGAGFVIDEGTMIADGFRVRRRDFKLLWAQR